MRTETVFGSGDMGEVVLLSVGCLLRDYEEESLGMSSMKLQGWYRESSWDERMPFHASRQAPVDPGRAKM